MSFFCLKTCAVSYVVSLAKDVHQTRCLKQSKSDGDIQPLPGANSVNQLQSSDTMIQTSETNQDAHVELLEKTSLQPKPQLAYPSALIAPGSILQTMLIPHPHLPSSDMSTGMLSQPLLNVLSSNNLLDIMNPMSWPLGPDPMVGFGFNEDMASSLMNGEFMSLLSNPMGDDWSTTAAQRNHQSYPIAFLQLPMGSTPIFPPLMNTHIAGTSNNPPPATSIQPSLHSSSAPVPNSPSTPALPASSMPVSHTTLTQPSLSSASVDESTTRSLLSPTNSWWNPQES
jgi:hypothetical protein